MYHSTDFLLSSRDRSQIRVHRSVGGVSIKCIASNIRRLNLPWDSYQIIPGPGKEGNLVVVEALTSVGFRTEVEDQSGVDIPIRKGDRFVAVLANRHSGTSESGDIPPKGIRKGAKLHLLAAGGVVGIKSGAPAGYQEPMELICLGLVADKDRKPLDLISICGGHQKLRASAPIVLVCGTSAEVGKTTTAKNIIQAITKQGYRVAASKLSGTGRMRDILNLQQAGASTALDFPEVGLATTYTSPERFTPASHTLIHYLNMHKPDIIVAEAGGDVIEANIPTFLADKQLMKHVKAICLVAGDVMGMMGTVTYLQRYASNIPIYLADPKGRNPITTRERVAHELPGLTCFNSLDPPEVTSIVKQLMKGTQ